jgi:hypothetical protein
MLAGLPHLFGISQVPPCLPTVEGATAVMVGPSSSSHGGIEPLPKKARLESILWVSSQYLLIRMLLMWVLLLLLTSLNSKSGLCVAGVVPQQL